MQQAVRLSWSPKAEHHVQNSSPVGPVLSQINPVHILPHHFIRINVYVTIASKNRYSCFPRKMSYVILASPCVVHENPISSVCFHRIKYMHEKSYAVRITQFILQELASFKMS
jgi:hypothetical protein